MNQQKCLFSALLLLTSLLSLNLAQAQEKNFTESFSFEAKPVITTEYLNKERIKYVSPEDFNGMLERGFTKLEEGLVEEAIADFKTIVAGTPEYGVGYYGIGLCYNHKQDTAQARVYFEKAIAKDATFGPAYLELGDLLLNNKPELALLYYTAAKNLMPDSADPLHRLSLISLKENKITQAKRRLNQGLLLDPTHLSSNYMMGRILFMESKYDEAKACFTNYINANPVNSEIYLWRAFCNSYRKKNDEALADLNAGLEVDQDNLIIYFIRGALQYQNKAYLDATKDFVHTFSLIPRENSDFKPQEGFFPNTEEYKTLLRVVLEPKNFEDPKKQAAMARGACALLMQDTKTAEHAIKPYLKNGDAITHYLKGLILEQLHKPGEAVKHYEFCTNGSVVFSDAQKRIGLIYFSALDEKSTAFTIFDKLTQEDPNWIPGHKYKGMILMMEKEYEKAIGHFSKAINMDTTGSDLYFNRSNCYSALQEYEKSLSDIEKVIFLKPKDAQAWEVKGEIKLAMGDAYGAKEAFSTSLRFKFSPEVYYKRGLILQQEKSYAEAIADFKKVEPYSKNHLAAQINMVKCQLLLRDYANADTILNSLEKRFSTEPLVFLFRGVYYEELKNQKEANYYYKKAKKLGFKEAGKYIKE